MYVITVLQSHWFFTPHYQNAAAKDIVTVRKDNLLLCGTYALGNQMDGSRCLFDLLKRQ